MPSRPNVSTISAVTVCPSRLSAIMLVMLMRPTAKQLKIVVKMPIAPPV